MRWHLVRNGVKIGPLSDEDLARLARENGLSPGDFVWRPGLATWIRVDEATELQTQQSPPPEGQVAGMGVPGEPALDPPSAPPAAEPLPSSAAPTVWAGTQPGSILGLGLHDAAVPPLPAGSILASAWPRYWARQLDLYTDAMLVGFLVGAVAPTAAASLRAQPGGALLANVVYVPMTLLMDGIILALFGTTLGKSIQGVRVLDTDGRSPSLVRALRRNLGVYFAGYGLGIPIVSLVTFLSNHRHLAVGELTYWDRTVGTRVFDHGVTTVRTWLTALLNVVVLVISFILIAARATKAP